MGKFVQDRVKLDERLQTTTKTHDAVSVAASANSESAWVDCNGFDKVGVTALNDAATTSTISLHWSNDGIALHGSEVVVAASTIKEKAAETGIKARYVRVSLNNGDTLTHTMSAWVYLKV